MLSRRWPAWLSIVISSMFLPMIVACGETSPPPALTVTCGEQPGEYKPYRNVDLGIALCYPDGWAIEVVQIPYLSPSSTGQALFLSPAGVGGGLGEDDNDRFVIIRPNETVVSAKSPDDTVLDILNRETTWFFSEAEPEGTIDVEQIGDLEVASARYRPFAPDDNALALVRAMKSEQAVATASGFITGEADRRQVEAILDSIVIGLPQAAASDSESIEPTAALTEPALAAGLQVLESGWTHYTIDDGLVANNTTSIAVAADGALWFGSAGAGVSRFDGIRWDTYTTADGLVHNYVNDIAAAPDGSVWIATQQGLSHWDGQLWTSYTVDDGLPGKYVHSVAVEAQGAVWVYAWRGTEMPGIARFNNGSWRRFNTIRLSGLVSIVVAPDGLVWFAADNGATRYDGETWWHTTVHRPLGFETTPTPLLAIDNEGTLWMLSADDSVGTLSRFDGKAWITVTTVEGPEWWGSNMAFQADGSILFSHLSVYHPNEDTWTELPGAEGIDLNHREATAVQVTADGAVWFATSLGVLRYEAP